ncbi:Ankyrin-repeat containing-like protein [Cocos nucifera]|uniref:Ankyrin-repeat containing-like protein n=1 Tax=Cocos nucifera TaxID=13894 RepID=A0A8K0ICD6_COCNU|nr:Ankyrin-repeat containing-like protein [Cocos nucifera]
MQSEVKWYKYVKKSMKTPGFFALYNSHRKTAPKIFTKDHKDLMKEAQDWLINTSESCSVVAALVAAVAYTSATSVPGGHDQNTGIPVFEGQLVFQVFALSSLIALCFSATALVLFLSIVTSRFHEVEFETALPTKLIGGMTTLFVSIAANFISFCAGHFYIINNKLESRVYLLYGALSFPVMAFFLTSQLHLYVDLTRALLSEEPERSGRPHDF